MVSFIVQTLLNLIGSHIFICAFVSLAWGERSKKKHIAKTYVRVYLSMFFSRSSMGSGLTFRCLIHFEFIFLYGVRKCSDFILLHEAVQVSQQHLLKRLLFPHCIFLPSLSHINWLYVCRFISGLFILFYWSMHLFLCQYQSVFNYYSFVLYFETRACDASKFVLSQEWFGGLEKMAEE